MSRNGSGTYNLVVNSWNPAVSGVSATPTDWQSLIDDVAAALTQSVSADGQTPITGNLNMGGNVLTSLGAGAATGQSLRWEQLFSQGTEADIASAATVNIGAQNTNFLRVTGTTTITSFGTSYNGPRFLRFADALTLTHNGTTLILPGAANITTAAGDQAIAVPIGNPGSGWRVFYQRANGAAISGVSSGPVTTSGLTMATARVLGRTTAATGAIEELTGTTVETLLPFGQTRIDVASAATLNLTSSAPNTDHINITGTTTITGVTVAAGRVYFVRFAGALTLTNNANIVTQTGANITTDAGDTCIFRATAANTVEVLCYTSTSKINLGASVASTSGTSIDFTGIPSWARRVTVMLSEVSTSGSSQVQIQVGAGSVVTTGYVGSTDAQISSGGSTASVTSGLVIERSGPASAATSRFGQAVFSKVTGNRWVGTYVGGANTPFVAWGATTINLGGALDRVRLTTVGGTDTFDAGTVNISWE